MTDQIKTRIPANFLGQIFLDLEDRCRAEALRAFEMVRDHARLDKKRARELEGQARFRMMEKGFQEVCELRGAELVPNHTIPSTDLKIFQPFMRFRVEGQGVILGLATMPSAGELPVKNKSRLAGVTLNYHFQPTLNYGGDQPKMGDIFVLFLISRDRERAGKIEEVAVGVINSKYDQYLFYEPLRDFLTGQLDRLDAQSDAETTVQLVRLKTQPERFTPPEAQATDL